MVVDNELKFGSESYINKLHLFANFQLSNINCLRTKFAESKTNLDLQFTIEDKIIYL